MADLALTPPVATAIFVLACVAGYRFRHTWKAEGPVWQLWLWGLMSAVGLLVLGFVAVVPGT